MLAVGFDHSDLLGKPSQFLKVDQTFNLGLVALVQEGEVLLGDGEEGHQRWVSGALKLTILGHVVKWIHIACHVLDNEFILCQVKGLFIHIHTSTRINPKMYGLISLIKSSLNTVNGPL